MKPSATSTTVTGPVGKRLQAGTEDASVLDRPTPLKRFHDSGARYKYQDLPTSFLYTCLILDLTRPLVNRWSPIVTPL